VFRRERRCSVGHGHVGRVSTRDNSTCNGEVEGIAWHEQS
jgi:hypothetical protein